MYFDALQIQEARETCYHMHQFSCRFFQLRFGAFSVVCVHCSPDMFPSANMVFFCSKIEVLLAQPSLAVQGGMQLICICLTRSTDGVLLSDLRDPFFHVKQQNRSNMKIHDATL